MKFIEEVVVETFLPTYRSMLAEQLLDAEVTQEEVAAHLGITQSAVSKYAHGEVSRHPAIEGDERVQDLVDRIAVGLVDGSLTPVEALIEAEVLIRDLERGDLLANLHRQEVPELTEMPEASGIHDPGGHLRERLRILNALRRGIARLERMPGFATLIPQVGSNLVFARPDAADIDAVAGVPGRIVDVKGRATVPAEPEFGVSEHVASIILAARDAGSDHRAAINLALTPEVMHRLEVGGYRTVEVPPGADLTEAVQRAIRSTPDAQVIYHEAGEGIEANTYILGPDPEAVLDIVAEVTSDA